MIVKNKVRQGTLLGELRQWYTPAVQKCTKSEFPEKCPLSDMCGRMLY